jgi:hypothetical protein
MHTFGETGVPAFLAKLWRLVEDEETNDLIGWSSVSDENKKYGIRKMCEKMMKLLNFTIFGYTKQINGLSGIIRVQVCNFGRQLPKSKSLCP